MNKRVVAVVLAGAMVASQLAGPVEVLATDTIGEVGATASEIPEKVLEEGTGVDTPVEAAKDNSVQTQAEKKAILAADNKVYGRTAADVSDATEITGADLDTVTDLMIEAAVTAVPATFRNKTSLTKLSFKDGTNAATSQTISIAANAFEGTGITEVTLPVKMATVGNEAFKGCASLASATLSAALTSVGDSVFESTALTTVEIPAAVTSIGAAAFRGTASLATINLTGAAALTSIGDNTFENSGLTTVAIPAAVTSIGTAAFKGSSNMRTLDLSGAGKLATIEASAFENVGALGQTLDLSTTVVTAIGDNAFKGTEISVAVLPATLLTIGNSAFQNVSNLLTVDFSKAVAMTAIGNNAFEGTAISAATFPATLLTIGDSAFKGTVDLLSTDFSTSTRITSIGESAFENSGVTGALDLSGIAAAVEIKVKAFKGNGKLTAVTLPGEMIALKAEVFAGTAIKTLELNEKSTTVDLTAFPDTLETLTVAARNTAFSAEGGVLYDLNKTKLKAVPKAIKVETLTLPATVTTVDVSAAKGNTSIKKVDLAASSELTDIEVSAFEGTTALKSLDLRKAAKLANVKADAFKDGALDYMYLGKNTKNFISGIVANAFNSTARTKIVKFLEDNDAEITGTDLTNLETTWTQLTTSANGGWIFYVKPTKPATPNAQIDYDNMKLTGLSNSIDYKITVDGVEVTVTSSGSGEIPIDKGWGGKTIQIASVAAGNNLESDPQSLVISGIFTVTVDGAVEDTTVAGKVITKTAPVKSGFTFKTWKAEGVELTNPTAAQITFNMPSNDVTLTTKYLQDTVVPAAITDYADMKLTGLSPNAVYTINSEEVTADSTGKIAIKKEWGGKTISIVKNETETEAESPVQSLVILDIYSITVGETEVAISVKDEAVTITAPALEGHLFKEWTEGYSDITVTVGNKDTETITFTMLAKDVTLKAVYTKIVVTKPEEMVYDGEKETSVEFDVPFANFDGIEVGGVMLVRDKDYTVSEGPVATLASGKTIVKFTKRYLDSLAKGVNAFKAVLKDGKKVDFSVKVVEKPTIPEKPPVVFPDVNAKEWYAKAVDYVSSKEYMTGFANGNFGPADILGRGQFASILHRMAGSPVQNYENLFADVPNGTFYTMPVVWAQKNNVIKGYQNGNFGPSDSMTREQLVTMLYRYTQIKGGNTVARASIENYPDKAKVSGFAVEAMQWGVAEGLVSGDNGTLNPQGLASRAVAATLIQRFEMKQKPPVTPPVTPPTP